MVEGMAAVGWAGAWVERLVGVREEVSVVVGRVGVEKEAEGVMVQGREVWGRVAVVRTVKWRSGDWVVVVRVEAG